MGLDQYLYRKEYLSGWKNLDKGTQDLELYGRLLEHYHLPRQEDSPHMIVDVCVGYWRKANAIHGYIVNNFAEGVDECQHIPLPVDALVDLQADCESVLAEFDAKGISAVPEAAEDVGLVPRSGFFFGSLEYDDYYIADLRYTVAILNTVLKDEETRPGEFYYLASW